ncbi:hypothetical protein JCM19237_301 [Photobacterium aphoticum]|uniref:Uncharacterized protein n=1 Tax=Photobacterium aphoticum TaxID=754436 RepID=A0A090QYH6_9GAMM|nr:hypothetical protein JCM19237_301 [Photobacterium aphoticum]
MPELQALNVAVNGFGTAIDSMGRYMTIHRFHYVGVPACHITIHGFQPGYVTRY